jgi:hypothetical protein
MALDCAAFIALDSIEALAGHYPGLEGKALEAKALEDWREVGQAEARRQAEAGPPAALAPLSVTVDGVRFDIYGVIHGMLGGETLAYRDFVRAGIEPLEAPAMENGLRLIYPNDAPEEMPDYVVLGFVGALWGGALFALQLPLLFWELGREWLRKESPDEASELAGGVLYHAVDPDVRRALGPDGDLPTGLTLAFEMGRWDASSVRARLVDPVALAPRSLFMAGYAVGCAARRGASALPLVVGDRHTAEIARFLEDGRWHSHPLFLRGRAVASRADLPRRWGARAAKVVHLSTMSLPGVAVYTPLLAMFFSWLMRRGL